MLCWLGRNRMLSGALALLMLGACASSANDPSLTPAQRALRQQTERFNETVATGAVAGALLGALAGALLAGNNRGNRLGGAAIGAAAGAALGGAGGYYIAGRNQRYASREQAAQSRLEAAQRESADLARTAALSDQVSRENAAKLAAARERYAAGQITRAQLDAQLRQAKADLALIQQGVEHSIKVEGAMRTDGVGGEASRVATSREQMQESADRLQAALARAEAA
ncbi:MAG: hypothetical protein IT556_12955 [Acetobacteraceae bacterium]|nr:hypothetical protein [Acetobacteraceae bacterium]